MNTTSTSAPVTPPIRKLRLSIKYKFLTLMALVVSATVLLYVVFALQLFKQDKSAYIFGTSLSTTEYINAQTQSYFKSQSEQVSLLLNLWVKSQSQQAVEELLKEQPHFVSFEVYKKKQGHFYRSKNFTNKSLNQENIEKFLRLPPLDQDDIKKILKNDNIVEQKMGLIHLLQKKSPDYLTVIRLNSEHLKSQLRKDNIYLNYIIDHKGQLLIGDFEQDAPLAKRPYIQTILQAKEIQKVSYYTNLDQEQILAAHTKNLHYQFSVISEIPTAKAFGVANLLINKSIYFGVFVVSIGLITGLFFSRSLTKPIEKLFELTQKIAQGNFKQRVKITSKDEIGVLSDSINYMSDEIVRYMDEMKEKVRLENEVAVANLVQSAFFPATLLPLEHLDIGSFHASASECGGDWWGHFHLEHKDIILIVDATGHGVPAALLTATANCCLSNLKQICQQQPHFHLSAEKILQFINYAVCQIGSDIMMTGCALIIDHEQKKLTLANASHNPPLLFRKPQQQREVDKSDLVPLMPEPGPRLGEKTDVNYQELQFDVFANDVIILFTDGIVEGLDPEGNQWGQRRFLKSILEVVKLPVDQAVEIITQRAQSFFKDRPYDDDITLVIAKVKEHGEA